MKRPMDLTDLRRRFPRDFVWGVATSAFQKPAAEIATPRYSFGKISDSSTHMTGPSDTAKLATNASRPMSTRVGSSAPPAALKPYAVSSNEAAIAAVPKINNGRRPTRSISSNATIVDNRLTMPSNTVCMNEVSESAPVLLKMMVA